MNLDILRKILPQKIVDGLCRLRENDIYELRLRSERAVVANYGGTYIFLGSGGKASFCDAVKVSAKEIADILTRATEHSLYAVNNQICEGYITIEGGVRIGIAGETVWADGEIKTIKCYNALNIRLPHEVIGCAKIPLRYIENNGVKSSLFIAPPGAGKTTLLRDVARSLGSGSKIYNVLIVDERNEIAAMNCGKMMLSVGVCSDVINGCTKKYAFTRAVRALKPDIIITDELVDREDVAATRYAIASGVTVIASVHARNCKELLAKSEFCDLLENRVFERYIIVSTANGMGTIDSILDENMQAIFRKNAYDN